MEMHYIVDLTTVSMVALRQAQQLCSVSYFRPKSTETVSSLSCVRHVAINVPEHAHVYKSLRQLCLKTYETKPALNNRDHMFVALNALLS